MTIIEKQYGYIVDLLSCGEIEGLVGGLSGVYLNETSLLSGNKYNQLKGSSGKCSVSGTGVTDANGLFSEVNFTDGERYLQIIGAGPSDTIAANMKSGSSYITLASASTLEDKHFLNFTGTEATDASDWVKHLIRISGAGLNGAEYSGILVSRVESLGTQAVIYPPISADISIGAAVKIDEVIKLDSSVPTTPNTCTLVGSATTAIVQSPCRLSAAVQYASSTTPSLAYDNTYGFVKNGSRYQLPLNAFSGRGRGAPSASIIVGNGTELLRHSSAGGSQGDSVIQGGTLNFSQYSLEEIDAVVVAIEFPGGLRHNGREGESRNVYVEFQIVLEYTADTGGAPVTKQALIYGKDYGGAEFDSGVPSWASPSGNQSTLINFAANSYGYSGGRNSSGVVTRKGANSPFIKEFVINLDKYKPFTNWSIIVKRLSPEALGEYCPTDNTFIASAKIKNVQALIYDKFSYPLTAYGAVTFSAEDFQTPPKRAYHLRGKKIAVPSNYFPRDEVASVTAQYTRVKGTGLDAATYQTWDGSFRGDDTLSRDDINFRKVYCNNPAWVYYDILTNKDYGLGDFISPNEIDKYALYQIARYCDEVVDNGKGGQEPRFSCNVYLQKQTEAYKVLKDLASVFRGMTFWIDGQITPVQDRPKEPVYTFSSANVEGGVFNYTYTGSKSRVNQINVSWNNPEEFYKRTILTVEEIGEIAKSGKIVAKNIVAFGATSESQARRVAKWQMATLLNETEIVSFTTSINGAFLLPGDVINIQDKDDIGIEVSGRTAPNSTTNVINLDRSITYPGGVPGDCLLYLVYPEPGIFLAQESVTLNGQTYTRGALLLEDNGGNPISSLEDSINLLDGAGNEVITTYSKNTRVEVKDINGGLSASNQVTVIGAFSSVPNIDVIWAVGRKQDTTTQEIKEYRILGVQEDDNEYSISASNYYPQKFDEIDVDPPVYTTDYIPVSGRLDDVPSPTNISMEMSPEARTSSSGNATGQKVTISWTSPIESFTDSTGVTTDIPYRFLSSYEIQHDFKEAAGLSNFKTETVSGVSNSMSISGVSEGLYTVRARTVNDLGVKSPWTTVRRFVSLSAAGNRRINSIAVGGVLSGDSFSTSSTDPGDSIVRLAGNAYSYSAPSGEEFSFLSTAGVEATQEDFGALALDAEAYLYFDASGAEESPPHPWKAVQIYTDEIVRGTNNILLNRPYIVPLGYVNNGLVSTSGTVSTTESSFSLIGVGTVFTTEFAVGDLIKVSPEAAAGTENLAAEYRTITFIESDTKLEVNTAFLRTQPGIFAFSQEFKPSIERDAILGKVNASSTSPSTYTLQLFINGKGPIGDNGQNVGIIATDYSIVYNGEGLSPEFTASTADSTSIGIETRSSTILAPEYNYKLNGVDVTFPAFTTNPFYLYTVPATWTQGGDVIEVNVRNIGEVSIILKDALSIARVKQGSGNLGGVITNPSQTISTDYGGRVFETNFPNASGEWELFFSGEDITDQATYSVVGGTSAAGLSTKTQNGLTIKVDEANGEYDLFQLDKPTLISISATVGGASSVYSVTPNKTAMIEGETVAFAVSGPASSTVYLEWAHVTTQDADFTPTTPTGTSRETINLSAGGTGTSATYTSVIDFDNSNQTFFVRLYDAATNGNIISSSEVVTVTGQSYNFSISSSSPTEGDTLTIHLETNNTNVTTMYLSFDSPVGVTTADFTNPSVGAVAPISARQPVTLVAGSADYTIDIAVDATDSGESFVPAVYSALTGGSPIHGFGTVSITDTGAPTGTAQLNSTSPLLWITVPVDGSVEAAGGSLQFLRSGDINGTEAFVYCSFGSAGIDSDDWCPVASRSSTVGDGYEIRWEQVGTLFPVASANWAESTYASLDSTKSVNAPTVFGSYYEPEMESIDINIKIRKVGAGSPDVDQTITLRSTVTS
jgi:hypothetical protein